MSRPIQILLISFLFSMAVPRQLEAKVTITRTNYHGWPDAFVMSNGKVSAVVVPLVGRVMQFGFVGEEGVFWENHALDGRVVDGQLIVWASKEWVNFGGDKTWPSPESNWGVFTGRKGWRPPPAFDGWPAEVHVSGGTLTLTTPVDPFYGALAERRIELNSSEPELRITTTYKRLKGDPAWMGIWVITQLKEPAGLFAAVPRKSIFPQGYTVLGQPPPPSLQVKNGLLSLVRDPKAAHKIGVDAGGLLWVGEKHVLRIDSPRTSKGPYPDNGSSAEIYTNPDPLQYIELETLGPVQQMKPGEKIVRSNTYTLYRRTKSTPEAEARARLGR